MRFHTLPYVPNFEHAVGLPNTSAARWCAFWWQEGIDEVWVTDGRVGLTGQPWLFLDWKHHRMVRRALAGVNIGYSDAPAEHALLLDRLNGHWYVAHLDDAQKFLARQWPDLYAGQREVPNLTQEDIEAILAAMEEMQPSQEEMQARVQAAMARDAEWHQAIVKFMAEAEHNEAHKN